MEEDRVTIEGFELLRADEVAALLSISPKTVYDLASRGEITSVRLGRRIVRWRRMDVLAYIDSRARPARQ